MQKLLIVFALFVASCAGSKEVVKPLIFNTKLEMRPFITEVAVSDPNGDTITKKVMIHNPLRSSIRVVVQCAQVYQDELVLDVDARRVRFAWVGASVKQEHSSSCQLLKYQVH